LYRVTITGYENFPKDTGYMICGNHTSNHDSPIMCLSYPGFPSYMGKQEIFKYKWLNPILYKMGGFPVDREGKDIGAIKKALRILKGGDQLVVFPEGTRNKTDKPLEAKSGVIVMAIKAKVPIVPVTIDSNYKLFKPIVVTFHPPVYYDEYYGKRLNNEESQALAQELVDGLYKDLKYWRS